MWLEIVLVFLLEASLVAFGSDEDGEEAYNNYKVDNYGNDLLDPPRPRREDSSVENATLSPVDAEAVKDAIQRLLGNLELPDYIAPTNPTRSPMPDPVANDSGIAVTRVETLVESVGDPLTTVAMKVTRSSYTQLLGQLIEYADRMGVTVKTPLRKGEGRQSSPPPTVAAELLSEDPEAALRARGYGFGGRKRTSSTTVTTKRTPNTLCTHDKEMCETMCFDKEKYRITCPSTTSTITTPRVDVSLLLYFLEDLVKEFDTNITEQFRLHLIKKGYASCLPTPVPRTTVVTTTEEPGIYDYAESNKTGDIISKCFVCGLEDPAIPMNAHCSDAFAGEFLPMTPVDAKARGKLATYRKYCKFMDMYGWYVNGTDSRSMWGRWTGGCTVRWVDLSGVYTQRTCRNRYRPTMGHHFVSKRMAKLEKALRRVDNGCIISPMASIVPFSRGVSLFARFHACVCTGNWCNGTARLGHRYWLAAVQMLVAISTYG